MGQQSNGEKDGKRPLEQVRMSETDREERKMEIRDTMGGERKRNQELEKERGEAMNKS